MNKKDILSEYEKYDDELTILQTQKVYRFLLEEESFKKFEYYYRTACNDTDQLFVSRVFVRDILRMVSS